MVLYRRSLQDLKESEETVRNKPIASRSMNLRLLHLFALAFLSAHLGIIAYADSKELFEDETPIQDFDNFDDSSTDLMQNFKRSWKSLQGSWGKRSDQGMTLEDYDNKQLEWNLVKAKERSNKQSLDDETEPEPESMKHYILFETNPNILASNAANFKDLEAKEPYSSNFEKKSWKNMNVAWGKRRSAVWNKFRGAWGKREPAWNNLRGMWGKRSTKDWKKLQSAWGKRDQQETNK